MECRIPFRDGTYDKTIWGEIRRSYKADYKDKIVFDIGACYGGYADFSLQNGASTTYSFEPEHYNYLYLQEYLSKLDGAHIIFGAVLNRKNYSGSMVTFYPSRTMNKGIGSLYIKGGRKVSYKVPVIDIQEMLDKYKPNIIKIDTEGAELDIIKHTIFPESVELIMLELHLNITKGREKAQEIQQWLSKSFKENIRVPKIKSKLWHDMTIWSK
jgi:FkbM family methyltransferase